MRQPTTVALAPATGRLAPLLFQSLVPVAAGSRARRTSATLAVSAGLHSVLIATLALLPLLLSRALPGARTGQTIFLPPLEIATLPPPPGQSGGAVKDARVVRVDPPLRGLVVPGPTATEITPEDAPGLLGSGDCPDPCVPGGLPPELLDLPFPPLPPLPPKAEERRVARVVRVSVYEQPKLLRRVAPVYPELAIASRTSAVVVLEAEVDTNGRVARVSVVQGHPLFDEAAIEAVRQWRYQALLLNGEPLGFILTVKIDFNLR